MANFIKAILGLFRGNRPVTVCASEITPVSNARTRTEASAHRRSRSADKAARSARKKNRRR